MISTLKVSDISVVNILDDCFEDFFDDFFLTYFLTFSSNCVV